MDVYKFMVYGTEYVVRKNWVQVQGAAVEEGQTNQQAAASLCAEILRLAKEVETWKRSDQLHAEEARRLREERGLLNSARDRLMANLEKERLRAERLAKSLDGLLGDHHTVEDLMAEMESLRAKAAQTKVVPITGAALTEHVNRLEDQVAEQARTIDRLKEENGLLSERLAHDVREIAEGIIASREKGMGGTAQFAFGPLAEERADLGRRLWGILRDHVVRHEDAEDCLRRLIAEATNATHAARVLAKEAERLREERASLIETADRRLRGLQERERSLRMETAARVVTSEQLAQEARRADELTSTIDSLWTRLKRRKAKIRKLRESRDDWKRSAIRASEEVRELQHAARQAGVERGVREGRAAEREAVLAYLFKQGERGITNSYGLGEDIRHGKHLTAPAAAQPQEPEPEQRSAPE